MKKLKLSASHKVFLILVILLMILAGWALKEREDYKRELAEKNMHEWSNLYQDVHRMISGCESLEDMARVDDSAGLTYFSREYLDVEPSLWASTYVAQDYISLIHNLADGSHGDDPFTQEELEEGFEIFLDMSHDLEQFFLSVIERGFKDGNQTEPDWAFQKGLIDYDSDVYRQVSKEIAELSAKYDKILKEFYKIVIVVG